MESKYIKARIIGARALQIFYGAPPLIKPKKNDDFYKVAKAEYEKKLIPFTVVD